MKISYLNSVDRFMINNINCNHSDFLKFDLAWHKFVRDIKIRLEPMLITVIKFLNKLKI